MKRLIGMLFIALLLITTAWAQVPQLETDGRAYPQRSLERAAYYVDENGYVTLQIIFRDSTGKLITTKNPMPVTMTSWSVTAPIEGYTTVTDGRKTVATPTSAEPLVGSATPSKKVEIQALFSNVERIAVGASTVVEATGTEQGTILLPGSSFTMYVEDLADIYIDVKNGGDGVSFTSFE